MEIEIYKETGDFAENKDIARDIRKNKIIPALMRGETIVINFDKINFVTQSFIHALISDIIRKETPKILERIEFKHCKDSIKRIIEIVTDYMQQED